MRGTGGRETGLEAGWCDQNYGGPRTVQSRRFNILEAGCLLPLREGSNGVGDMKGKNERRPRKARGACVSV